MNRKPSLVALAIALIMTAYWLSASSLPLTPAAASDKDTDPGKVAAAAAIGDLPYPFNPLRQRNLLTTIDNGDNVGTYTSITIGADGLPIISYRDEVGNRLKVAHCNDLACTGATITNLDVSSQHTSITLGSDGLAVISFYNSLLRDLRVAHCSNVLCTSATFAILDSAGIAGQFNSITIGGDGFPLISYYEAVQGDLKVADCDNLTCSSVTIRTLDSAGNVGQFTSIAMRVGNRPLISYHDVSNGDLKVADCLAECSGANYFSIDSVPTGSTGLMTSLAIGQDGNGMISYHSNTGANGGRLQLAHCDNFICNSATLRSGSPNYPGTGINSSIAIGSDGVPVISHFSQDQSFLAIVRCFDPTCEQGNNGALPTVLDGGNAGSNTSLTIGTDGLPIISYFDLANTNLKVVHCGDPTCTSFGRRR